MPGSSVYALSKTGLPPLGDWQKVLDGLDLLARLEFVDVASSPDRPSTMRVGDRQARFLCEEVSSQPLLGEALLRGRRTWSRAFRFGDLGSSVGATAALAACMSCALATDGAIVIGGETRPVSDIAETRHALDARIACNLGCEGNYLARYPDERPSEADGPVSLSIRLCR